MSEASPTRLALVGAGPDALPILEGILADKRVELVAILDPEPGEAFVLVQSHLEKNAPALLQGFHPLIAGDPGRIAREQPPDVIVDAMPPGTGNLAGKLRLALGPRAVQQMNALSARLIWGPRPGEEPTGAQPVGRRRVLRSLHEIIRAQNLAIGEEDLLSLILDTAVRTTGADRGSLMLIDPTDNQLKVRVAKGIEAELIPKIRFPVGEGIAGKVAQQGLPIRISGKADPRNFHILRDRDDVLSALSVPLTAEDRILGVLNVSSTHRGKEFSEDDLSFLTELAGLEAQIIVRSEEVRELRDSVEKFRTDKQVNQILASVLPLEDRLGRVCALICQWIPGASCAIYLPDETGALQARAAAPEQNREAGRAGLGGDAAVARWAFQECRATVLRGDSRARAGGAQARMAYAALPLVANEKSVGVLVAQVVSHRGLDEREENILRGVAEPIAEAVSSSLREESITRYATQVGAINEAGLRLLATDDLDELVKMITSSAGMILQCDACVLRLRDAETGRYTIRSYFGSSDVKLQKSLFAFDKKFVIRLLRRKEPILVSDVDADPELAGDEPSARGALGVPLRHPNGMLGTLALYDKLVPNSFYPVPFSPEDREILVRFTGFVERAVLQAIMAERSKKHDQLDEVTGLPNRSYLERRLGEELARAKRSGRQIGLMICRLANHAEFCERAGEEAGRRLVVKLSETLRDNLRGFDIVARTEELAFGILFPEPGLDAKEAITRLSVSLNDAVQADLPPDTPMKVQLHFGYAFHPEDGDTAETLWEKASQIRIRTQ